MHQSINHHHCFSSEPCIRVRVRAAMPALEIANRSAEWVLFENMLPEKKLAISTPF